MFSLPPTNHFANGRSHSSVVWNGSTQSTVSRAIVAQKASKSRSASSYSSGLALAPAAKAGSGGKVRDSASRFSISGDGVDGSTLNGSPRMRSRLARPSYRAGPPRATGRPSWTSAGRLFHALRQLVLVWGQTHVERAIAGVASEHDALRPWDLDPVLLERG